jgi:hypothetical protein
MNKYSVIAIYKSKPRIIIDNASYKSAKEIFKLANKYKIYSSVKIIKK